MDNVTTQFLTQATYDEYKSEYEYLTTVARAEVIKKIGVAKSYGDLSENSEYDAAREEQGKIESRIIELDAILKHCQIIDETAINIDEVGLGAYVTILDVELDMEAEYQIVGSTGADPMAGKLSSESPVGKAILGHKVGDEVVAEAPAGPIKVVIKAISKSNFS